MDFQTFMQSVEQNLAQLKSEEALRAWIKNYARSLPEEEREAFLEQLKNREPRSHKKMLREILQWCEKVNDAEDYTLSCHEYEDYESGYWDSDWITEYSDPEGIGPALKRYYEEAEQAVYDGDFVSASQMYWNLGGLTVMAVSVDGGDCVELTVEEMVSEGLVSLNLKKIAGLTLYAAYRANELPKRVSKLYQYFSRSMFREISLEDMITAGPEPLEEMQSFLDAWIAWLREQEDQYTPRLLIEAVKLRSGDEGLLEEAKRTANRHPQLYVQVLEKFFQNEDWDRLKEEGMEALRRMDRSMEIRERAARLAAAGAIHKGDEASAREAMTEAFYSKATAANYLRILTCQGQVLRDPADAAERDILRDAVDAAERDILRDAVDAAETEKILEQAGRLQEKWKQEKAAKQTERYYWQEHKVTDAYIQNESDRMGISFLSGDFAKIWEECRKTKDALGWSGKFINEGVPMLLLLLQEGEITGKAMRAMLSQVERYLAYQAEYGEPDFAERFQLWRSRIAIPVSEKKEILTYLAEVIDNRVQAIVGGYHRGSYFKAAMLGVALGEVEQSLGRVNGKVERVEKYLRQFPRHSAFKKEMMGYW